MTAVVVGYVARPEGEAALDAGLREAVLRGLPLVVVHSARGGEHENLEDAIAARDRVAELERRLADAQVSVTLEHLVRGNSPAEDLTEVAREHDAALVVIGLRRRSPVGKLLLGSNAQEILLRMECPVLAVKP